MACMESPERLPVPSPSVCCPARELRQAPSPAGRAGRWPLVGPGHPVFLVGSCRPGAGIACTCWHVAATQDLLKRGSGNEVMPLLSRQCRRHVHPQPQAGNPAARTARRISADNLTPCTSYSSSWPLSGTNCLASSSVGAVPSNSSSGE